MAITPSKDTKTVVVVGGGMAGMTAARIATMRGHNVTLLEKTAALGGQINLACIPPEKQEVSNWVIYLKEQLRRLGVPVVYDCNADESTIAGYSPDVVVVATGAQPLRPCANTVSDEVAAMAWDIISNEKAILGGNVLVVGGGSVGLETADLLLHRARGPIAITVMEMLDDIGADIVANNKIPLMRRLNSAGVQFRTGAELLAAGPGYAEYKAGGKTHRLEGITNVVFACGSKADNELYESIKDKFSNVVLVGDAATPAQALDAVRSAWEAMLKI